MAGAPNVPHYLVDLTDDNDEEERQEGRDEEMDDGEPRGDGAGPAPTRTQRIALHDFLRMIAGQQMMQGIPSSNNEEMVGNLRRTGVLTSADVERALLVCPRTLFVPEPYADQAYIDSPIRVHEHEFNISAPHMHSTMLEAMDLRPGDRVLDVGVGCGIIAACAAYLVGRGGSVTGLDVRPACTAMTAANLERLRLASAEFAEHACADVVVEQRNVFLPSDRHRGKYNKIHVGAACPEDKLPALVELLDPTVPGCLLVPVDSELRLLRRSPDGGGGAPGHISQRVISQVRFTELDVPPDAEIALSALDEELRSARTITVPPSTFASDVAQLERSLAARSVPAGDIEGAVGGPGSALPPGVAEAAALAGVADPARFLAAAADASGAGYVGGGGAATASRSVDSKPPGVGGAAIVRDAALAKLLTLLGPPDCRIVGPGYTFGAHKAWLALRCDHFRARFASGMRDADDAELSVPEDFNQAGVAAMLRYLYGDDVSLAAAAAAAAAAAPGADAGTALTAGGAEASVAAVATAVAADVQQAAALLEVASYYAVDGRLAALVEARLSAHLAAPPLPSVPPAPNNSADACMLDFALYAAKAAAAKADAAAPALLLLAERFDLKQLSAAARCHVVDHWSSVSATDAYVALPEDTKASVTSELARRHIRLLELLRDLAGRKRCRMSGMRAQLPPPETPRGATVVYL